ncbi:MAG: phosphoribosylglycinamide formyltransferase [Deltaproteobacteria bacterium]|nr:phosphoribosylglycinamide formyltransferase [Deltaproteobacteria bacterium]
MNLGILISGRGSNMDAILAAIEEGRLDASVPIVVSNRAGVAGLDRARARGVPTLVLAHREHPSREAFDEALVEALRRHDVDTVALAGFDRLLSPVLLSAFPGRVVNIHPALLPSFPGLHAQQQALDYGVRITGATVHLVDERMDHGPILAQAAVPVLDDDTEDTLAERILAEEHRIYPLALALLAHDEVRIEGRRVRGGVPTA